MSVDEMLGKYMRLRQELADAYDAPRWNEPYLDRLTEEMSELERALARAQPVDEQTSDMWPGQVGRASAIGRGAMPAGHGRAGG